MHTRLASSFVVNGSGVKVFIENTGKKARNFDMRAVYSRVLFQPVGPWAIRKEKKTSVGSGHVFSGCRRGSWEQVKELWQFTMLVGRVCVLGAG